MKIVWFVFLITILVLRQTKLKRALNYSNTKEFNAYDAEKSYILDPIEDYYSLIRNISGSLRFLEIGAGMGENSEPILKAGHKLHSTDISSESV